MLFLLYFYELTVQMFCRNKRPEFTAWLAEVKQVYFFLLFVHVDAHSYRGTEVYVKIHIMTKVIQFFNLVSLLMWTQVNLEALSNWEEKQMFKE